MKKFDLMALPYADNALEPLISKETIGFHHGKHLQAYVNNLNGLLEGRARERAMPAASSRQVSTVSDVQRCAQPIWRPSENRQ